MPFRTPPPGYQLAEEILRRLLWSTIRYSSEQAGTCFQKAAGPGDHVSLLDTINWVMSQSHNEDKFWCLLQLSWEMHLHRPKSHRGRESRTDLLCLWGPHGHRQMVSAMGLLCGQINSFFCCSQRPLDVILSHPERLISNRGKWEEAEVDSKQATQGG